MRQSEIPELVKAFQAPKRWSQHSEARTLRGQPCHYDDPKAWAFSLDGLMFKLFGPTRALEQMLSLAVGLQLYRLDENLRVRPFISYPDPPGIALTAVIDFNDTSNFSEIRRRLLRLEPSR